MSIRLAPASDPARTAGRHAAGRGLVTRVRVLAANDNGGAVDEAPVAGAFDPVLVEALAVPSSTPYATPVRRRLFLKIPTAPDWRRRWHWWNSFGQTRQLATKALQTS